MIFDQRAKMPGRPSQKMLSIRTLCRASIESLKYYTHTYLFIAAPAAVVWKGTVCVFILPTVVLEHGWMDGRQTEVRGREGLRSKKQWNRCCANLAAQRWKRFFFPLLPFALNILNNCYEGLKFPLKRFSLAFKTSSRNREEKRRHGGLLAVSWSVVLTVRLTCLYFIIISSSNLLNNYDRE